MAGLPPLQEDMVEMISPIGYSNSSRCGYCGSHGQSFSYYANAVSLSSHFYQIILDRSWRRSGKLLYRPNQRRSCCPHYTIRLDSHNFHPLRDQRQAVNRFNKFVLGDSYMKEAARLYPRSREETKRRDNEFCLSERIHEAEYKNVKTPPKPAHKFEVTLEEDVFTLEKYLVYDNYQRVVHGDEPEDRSQQSFSRFLCSSPLKREVMVDDNGQERRLGSYHQCYRLDGQLVAIGVLDLLPDCVSSVYFLYHESIHKFSPGKLGALHEIALAIECGYRWWYPGFYIHSCPKMRYKIDYMPQYILDPEDSSWHLIDEGVLHVLDQRPYVSLGTARVTRTPSALQRASVEPLTRADGKNITSVAGKETSPSDSSNQGGSEGENEDEDEDEYFGYHRSLFRARMPGIPSLAEAEKMDLDHIALKIFPNGPLYETLELVNWATCNVSDLSGIKHTVAELVAALGPDLKDLICLDMMRYRRLR